MLVAQLCLILCNLKDCSSPPPPTPLSIEFSRQEYWSGLPFLSPGDLPDPGIEPRSLKEVRFLIYFAEILEMQG